MARDEKRKGLRKLVYQAGRTLMAAIKALWPGASVAMLAIGCALSASAAQAQTTLVMCNPQISNPGGWTIESGFPGTLTDDADANGVNWQGTVSASWQYVTYTLCLASGDPIPSGTTFAAGAWSIVWRGSGDPNRNTWRVYIYDGGVRRGELDCNFNTCGFPTSSVGNFSEDTASMGENVLDGSQLTVLWGTRQYVSGGSGGVLIEEFEITATTATFPASGSTTQSPSPRLPGELIPGLAPFGPLM